MKRMLRRNYKIASALCAALTIFAATVLAGPPLLCWPFDIGGAKSLPFVGDNWQSSDPSYNIQNLPADTAAILQPGTPVIVRMETIRRATVYAMKDRKIAALLLQRIEARLHDPEKQGKPAEALALFDLGYMVETFKQTGHREDSLAGLAGDRDGYALMAKALAQRGPDAEMEFAAAMVQCGSRDASRTAQSKEHVKQAVAGASEGSALARNLVTHAHLLQITGNSLGELRAQLK